MKRDFSPSRITSLLSGTNNFTIETMVRAARAVGAKYHHGLTREVSVPRKRTAR
jgi:hypothetical protein